MSAQLSTVTVTPKEASSLVIEHVKRDQPVMLWGGTGIGKTSIMRQVAKQLDKKLITILASIKQPVDLAGIPVPDMANNVCRWLTPSELPREDRDGTDGLLFLDEINAVNQMMQAALHQLVNEAKVGEHKIARGWARVAAGNRLTDRAAAQRMPTALANRFKHYNVEPSVEDWCEYQAARGGNPLYSAFLRFRPELIYLAPGGETERVKIAPDAVAFPTPRTHEDASTFLDVADPVKRFHLVSSAVGEGTAHEVEGFLRLTKDLPTFGEVVADPKHARVPPVSEPASRYAVASMVASQASKETIDAVFTYAARLGGEFEMLVASEISKRHPDLTETGAYTSFAISNQHEVL